jgi:hypothetical protein
MVKFQEYWVEKRCKGSGLCRYRGVLLRIPKRFHGKVDSFIGLDFDMKDIVTRKVGEEQILDIVLATKKSVITRQIKATA